MSSRIQRTSACRALVLGVGLLVAGGCGGGEVGPGSGPAPQERVSAPRPESFEGLDPKAVELIQAAAEAVDGEPADAAVWGQLAQVYHAHRRFGLAADCYRQALVRDPQDARSWYLLSRVEDQLGETDAALEHLRECARYEDYPPAHWRLGYLLLARGELDSAEEAMREAMAQAPHDAAAVVGLARIVLQQGRASDAVTLLEEHLRRVPRDAHAKVLFGTALREVGRGEEAARLLAGGEGGAPIQSDPWEQSMLSLRQGFRTDFLRAVRWLDAGEVDRAVVALEQLLARSPDDVLVLINLHRGYRMQGKLNEAIELLARARRIEPLRDVVHLHLAGAFWEQAWLGREEPDVSLLGLALQSAREACELSPTYAAAHAMHGDVLEDLGRPEAAAEAFAQAARLDSTSAPWQLRAGHALCELNRWADAVPLLEQHGRLEPDSVKGLFLLSAALANSGRLEEATAPLERARQLSPKDPVLLDAIADLEHRKAQGAVEGQPQ